MLLDTDKNTKNGTDIRGKRKTNIELRPREYLKSNEIDRLIKAAREARQGERDALMISLAFNHALRVSELVNLEWDQIDLRLGQLRVHRLKNNRNGMHYLSPKEINALKALCKDVQSRFVFTAEGRITPIGIRAFHKLISAAGERANIGFPIHPHMLRHSKGYQLVNRNTDLSLIQQYLGHRSIVSTLRYTELDPDKIKGLEL